ncbi:MAG: aminodeoxychorismate synthase component I, partial [Micavibrio aeruginosavorus]
WSRQKTREEYKQDIQTVINYIHAGDVFQVNLAQKFTAELPDYFNPYAHYLHLRKVNPAPFSSFMRIDNIVLSSTSPERFLKVSGTSIETRPIKGTIADSEHPSVLLNSAKDRAENTMIVDLLRNDLSKVCEANSIQVPELCAIESYSGLHHLVSSVTGKLKKDKTSLDALSACFPGGSITGAPKIRAMEIIEELEPTCRGAYCGAIGYIGFDGTMDTNIAIRTLIYKDNQVSLSVGGGIVAASDLEAEYQETLVKARKIFESFENSVETPSKIAQQG